MPEELRAILPPILMAAGFGALGGIIALYWRPQAWARIAIQHFAAGAVIAAVSSGVIPDAERLGTTSSILTGFAAGGLVMIGLKWLVLTFERMEQERGRRPIGLAAAAAVDTLVDGALISAGFSSGRQLGTLLAIALTIELFFLTLSVGLSFRQDASQRWVGVIVTSGIACLLLVAMNTILLCSPVGAESVSTVSRAKGEACALRMR